MRNVIQTTERTFNKNIKKQILDLMPLAKSFKKLHVAGMGYVYYILDQDKNTLGFVNKEVVKGMKIMIKQN